MNFNNFTIKAQEAVQQAVQLVSQNNQQAIEGVHLLKAVIMTGESITNFLFQKLGVNQQNVMKVVDAQIASLPKVSGGEPYLSGEANAILQKAIDYSSKMGDQYVSLEPIILALFTEKSTASQILKDAGMTLLYHNHDFEFTKLEDGQYGLDYLYANVPADLLQTELDECWVKYSGEDPVAYLKKYAGRSPLVHIKDFYAEGKQEGDPYALIGLNEGEQKKAGTFEFRPLGEGLQDIPAIIKAAEESGSKWLIVEQDDPSMGKTPMECVTMSINYLKDNYINCSGDCSTVDCAACPESKSCEDCPEAK